MSHFATRSNVKMLKNLSLHAHVCFLNAIFFKNDLVKSCESPMIFAQSDIMCHVADVQKSNELHARSSMAFRRDVFDSIFA